MAEILCRHFSGYKPCNLNDLCDLSCKSRELVQTRVLIVHLGAIGAVVRSTSLLKAIHKKYPAAHVTWVTQKPSQHILMHNPRIHRVLTLDQADLLMLSCLEFDVGFCIDKSLVACGVVKNTKVKKLFGFRAESTTGSIIPANDEAFELWELGLSNQKKFFENKKPETQLMFEAMNLDYTRDEYDIVLSKEEEQIANEKRLRWGKDGQLILGLNTGCSSVIPYKKLTVDMHRRLIHTVIGLNMSVVLLGGPEDTIRNQQISYGLNVIHSPTNLGLRDGLTSVKACDIVVTGDSLGMHMAIALKKFVVAWFGPTCSHEIDLYGRGEKVHSQATCGPCWKRSCHKPSMCYDLVDLNEMVNGIKKGIAWSTSSSIQPLSGTSSSPSLSLNTCRESMMEIESF